MVAPKRAEANQAFLLRLWHEADTPGGDWRASLMDTRTGVRFGFANLEQLFIFLMERTWQPPADG